MTNVLAVRGRSSTYQKSKSVKSYPQIIEGLLQQKLYYAAIPYVKESLVVSPYKNNTHLDRLIDKIVNVVGIKQFEVLPERFLKKSNAPMIKYILAKKYFTVGKYNQSLQMLSGSIPRNHPAKPFALLLQGSIYSIQKKYLTSINILNECVALSNGKSRQESINRDYCIVGIARAYFAKKDFKNANLAYLDLKKESHVWPEILFEEAWNSFYMKNYNRTLGKLVTYKAPIFNYFFNTEIEILRALTYMELCLWKDAKIVVNKFYKKYSGGANYLNSFLKTHGKDVTYYYQLIKSKMRKTHRGNSMLSRILKSIIKDPTFIELWKSYTLGLKELSKVSSGSSRGNRRIIKSNIKESVVLQQKLIGAYVRKKIFLIKDILNRSFEDMSYIKLEVLSRKKKNLYNISNNKRSRGSLSNLSITDKQYFWTFNGEFWADELGDYVFSLKSECN